MNVRQLIERLNSMPPNYTVDVRIEGDSDFVVDDLAVIPASTASRDDGWVTLILGDAS